VFAIFAQENQLFVEEVVLHIIDDPGSSVVRNWSPHLCTITIFHGPSLPIKKSNDFAKWLKPPIIGNRPDLSLFVANRRIGKSVQSPLPGEQFLHGTLFEVAFFGDELL